MSKSQSRHSKANSCVFEAYGKGKFSQWSSSLCFQVVRFTRDPRFPDDASRGQLKIIQNWKQRKTTKGNNAPMEKPQFSEETRNKWKGMFFINRFS
jgi:hypothetical protein